MTEAAQAADRSRIGDLWGGLAAMLVALPSSIAFGVLIYTEIGPDHAGEGALAGILGAAVLGLVAPLVGRNGGFITAPCAPAAAVLSAFAADLASSGDLSAGRIIALLGLTALISGFMQFGYGAVRAGQLIKYIPYQVVSGYLSGVALIIAIGQLPKLLGLPAGIPLATGLPQPALWNWGSIAVGLVTIGVIAVAPRFTQKVPAAILGLLAGVVAYFGIALLDPGMLRLEGNHLVIGPIETSHSFIEAAGARATSMLTVHGEDIGMVLVTALTLSLLLSIDTLKTGVVLDALAHRRHNSNRELVGQGAANVASFLVGGMPGAGTMGPTLVNFTSGGRTLWSGVAEGAFVVAAFAVLGGLIAWVPIGALAGVLLVVAWRMFDRHMFRLLLQPSTRVDFAVIAVVAAVAQFELIAASAVGIVLAILLFIRDQIRGSVIISKRDLRSIHSKRHRLAAESEIIEQHGEEAEVVQLQGNLFFGTTDQLFSELERDLSRLRYLLLDLRRVQSMDFTAAHLFEQMKERLEERDGELLFSGMPSGMPTGHDIERYMAQLGLVRSGRGIRVFDTRESAIEWMEDSVLRRAGWKTQEEGPPLALGEIEVFSELDAALIAEIAGVAEELSFPAGGRICTRGEVSDKLYLVRRGRLNVLLPLEAGGQHHLATVCRGDFFGELTFLDRQPRSANVEAATEADLFSISRERFDEVVKRNPALGNRIFEQLAYVISNRLRSADTELRVLEER